MKPHKVLDYPSGGYELTETIKNPKPDKRVARKLEDKAEWPKGTKLLLCTRHYGDVVVQELRPISGHEYGSITAVDEYKRLELFKDKLIPHDSIYVLLTQCGFAAESVLKALVDSGTLSLNQIREAVNADVGVDVFKD